MLPSQNETKHVREYTAEVGGSHSFPPRMQSKSMALKLGSCGRTGAVSSNDGSWCTSSGGTTVECVAGVLSAAVEGIVPCTT